MKYPDFLKKGDGIAVTGISDGIVEEKKLLKYENAIKNIENMGFRFCETENVRQSKNGRSSSASERAKQFMKVWEDENVASIIGAAGGDFACEMLDELDFETLKNAKPKWFQGFSDSTNLGFVLTTNLEIATIYGETIKDYGACELFENLTNSIKLMQGEEIVQKGFGVCEPQDAQREGFESYRLTQKTVWKNLKGEKKFHFSGRSIGGCFDVIINLIGTKYDNVKNYIEKYKKDGIVWFFDIFEMSTPQIFCHLWQMKNAGYFEHCKGILFGRSFMVREDYEMSLADVVKDAIGKLQIPIVLDIDIGHVPPQMPIVNGAILEVESSDEKSEIKTFLR